MHKYAIANQKGGCGKSTTAVNMGAALAELGHRVLIVDLDPQAHATIGLGVDPYSLDLSVYEVLIKPECSARQVIVETEFENISIMPANILLSGADIELVNRMGRESVLEEALKELDNEYDFVILDCSPSLSLLTVNALKYADKVIVPMQAHYYAMEGMKQLFGTIDEVKRRLNPDLQLLGILLTMVDYRTNVCRDVVEGVRDYFKDKVLNTLIRTNVKLVEAPSSGKPISIYAPGAAGDKDYKALAQEVLIIEGMMEPPAPVEVEEPVAIQESLQETSIGVA